MYSHRHSSAGTTDATASGASATAEGRVGTLPLEVRLVSSSMWRVSDAVLFHTARDTAALTMSRLLTSSTDLGAATDLRTTVDAVNGFDRTALEELLADASHPIVRDARS